MRRVLALAASIVAYFCVATCIAEAIMVGYVVSQKNIDREKLMQIMAVLHGIDLTRVQGAPETAPDAPQEQVSLEQIAQARAIHVRHLELREQALKAGLEQLLFDEQKLAEEKKRYDRQREEFEARLLALQQEAEGAGISELTAIMEKIKSRQAKEQIMRMLADDEIEEVVTLLAGMQDTKRAKIIGEFKTPEESAKLAEVLRRIREGDPLSGLAEGTQEQLTPEPPAVGP